MKYFVGNDINSIYLDALFYSIESNAISTNSRAGNVFDFGPAFFEFLNPVNQLLLLNKRKFNPYFAIVESAWILSGRNQLSDLKKIINNYGQFSDDGISLNGAYGYRIRFYFKLDQLELTIKLLKDRPDTRRAVITLYSPNDLVNNNSLDVPCNTAIYFKIRNNKLDLTVVNRSNDLYLGIPYNVFVFNIVQKYVAYRLGLQVGVQSHFTDSLHLYVQDLCKVKTIINSNTFEKIREWCLNLDGTNNLTEGIIESYKEISVLNVDNISNSYCRNILENYLKYKISGKKSCLKDSLPFDLFGLSTKLWLNSLS